MPLSLVSPRLACPARRESDVLCVGETVESRKFMISTERRELMGGPSGAFKNRPIKTAAIKRKRIKAQKKRLLAGGLDEAVVENMTIKEVREGLKKVPVK